LSRTVKEVISSMDFKKYKLCLEDRRDFDETEEILTLSSNDGGIPLMSGFCSPKDQFEKGIDIGDSFEAFLQAQLDPRADFELYKDAEEYKEQCKRNFASESFFPEWFTTDDGKTCYEEFSYITGTVNDAMEYDEDHYLVKLSCEGYEFACLIPSMPSGIPGKGNIIFGDFLMMFDLEQPY